MMYQIGPSPEILYQINRLLTNKDTKQKETVEKRSVEDDSPLNDGTDDCENDEEKQDSEDECADDDYDCIVEREVKKFKPKKISYLTLLDENMEQKVIQKSKPVIYGTGAFKCVCGASIKNKRHIKDHERTNKHQLYIYRNAEKW